MRTLKKKLFLQNLFNKYKINAEQKLFKLIKTGRVEIERQGLLRGMVIDAM